MNIVCFGFGVFDLGLFDFVHDYIGKTQINQIASQDIANSGSDTVYCLIVTNRVTPVN